jgi:hypothetical protein
MDTKTGGNFFPLNSERVPQRKGKGFHIGGVAPESGVDFHGELPHPGLTAEMVDVPARLALPFLPR